MEKLFPTGNQTICPRIRYPNEPGFTHAHFPSRSVSEPSFTKKTDIAFPVLHAHQLVSIKYS